MVGRDKVVDLRAAVGPELSLPDALASLRDEIEVVGGSSPTFGFVVEGQERDIGLLVRDEVFQIAREAVRNAVRHAAAQRIEIELSYGRRGLVLRVRDDGIGMDDALLSHGRHGHWGLQGMRERSERVDGLLTVWSQPGAGTEIEMTVPAATAFGKARRHAGGRRT